MRYIYGTNESDWLLGDQFDNVIRGFRGNDLIDGGRGNDRLYGNQGNDWFIPGLGVDRIYGGFLGSDAGNDTVSYSSYQWNVRVNLLAGYGESIPNGAADRDYLHGIENVVGSAYGDELTGNLLDNKIDAGGGNDGLKGSGGDDILNGGSGNDHFWSGTGADRMDGGTGVDTVVYSDDNAGITVSLNLTFATDGYGAVDRIFNIENVTGTNYDDNISANNSNNVIHGRYGIDTIYGYGGSDTITGGSLNDVILGGHGNDHISGDYHDDTINGGGGNDTLIGGRDADELTGGGGQDSFEFTAATDSGNALASMDFITDFSQAQGDRIRIHGFDANTTIGGDQEFTFLGEGAFTGDGGQIRYVQLNNSTRVLADLDGDSAADFAIYLTGYHDLTAGDFSFT